MALNIKNPEVERLAEEASRLAGETKTESIRKALEPGLAQDDPDDRRAVEDHAPSGP